MPRTLVFEIALADPEMGRDGDVVRLTVDDEAAIEAPFDDKFLYESATVRVLGLIETGTCTLDDIKLVGSRLWSSLRPGPLGARIATLQKDEPGASIALRLKLPEWRDHLPWESLYDWRDGFLSAHPRTTLAQRPPGVLDVLFPTRPPLEKLRMLVVIPVGSGLNVEAEWKSIELALGPIRSRIEGESPVLLKGRVTSDGLHKALKQHAYDVVHFIGHGTRADDGSTTIRLNDDAGNAADVGPEAFAASFRHMPPRLVFLNCCHAGATVGKFGLGGFGPALLGAGVPAVVAMRHAVPDRVAIQFSAAFYAELLVGETPGRVDVAVTSGREAILRNHRGFSAQSLLAPLLHLAQESDQLFSLKPSADAAATRPPASKSPRRNALPEKLALAMKKHRCVPVLGPGLLSAMRSSTTVSPIAPRALAERLARSSGFPEMGELELERLGDWHDQILLARVCQHYEHKLERAALTEEILAAHVAERSVPPSIAAVTRWSVPGIVTTHFDGLIESAFQEARRDYASITTLDASIATGSRSAPLLIHLRGSLRDADSLVLTDQDHDTLWDRLDRPSGQIESLITGEIGRSLVVLGVSPRDAWVKRLARRLVPPRAVNAGPIFFVCREPSPVDQACWQGLRVEWVSMEPEAAIEALSEIGS